MIVPRPLFRAVTAVTKDHGVYRAFVRSGQRLELWLDAAGLRRRVSPPPLYKRRLLGEVARRIGAAAFLETGTYLGDTAFELSRVVERVYTIELDPGLAARARERFADVPNVTVLEGDSGALLAEIVPRLAGPVLFWLDAHHSNGFTARGEEASPIVSELETVFAHWTDGSAVLADDADCFVGRDGYPSLAALRRLVAERRPDLEVRVERNVIRMLPAPAYDVPGNGPAR